MAHQDEAPTENTPFAEPLTPYIKSRQEALRIRQVLTAYLRSQIIFRDDDPNSHAQSHLSLCVPNDSVVDVKPIPPEVTGLRRQYLEALQANVAAKKKYEAISEKITSRRLQQEDHETPAQDPNSDFQAYLKLLRGRRHHAKLQVLQHYLGELKTRDVPGSDHFENQAATSQQIEPPELLEGQTGDSGSKDNLEELVHKLERAVIRAKSQLDREKKLLEEVKARHESNGPRDEDIPSAVKARALQRTRDELVQWIEEKLVSTGGGDSDPVESLSPDELEDSARLLEERKEQIRRQYAAYIEARKKLLDAASKACQPVATTPAPMPTTQSRVNDRKTTPEQAPSIHPIDALAFTSENIVPLSKSQRALALQRSYLSGMVAKEKATTLRMLNRLSDESHLLPEYPILARQPRFKHATAALKPRRATNSAEPTKPDEVVSLAEAWAFASGAAEENERENVEQQIEICDETIQDAQKTLQEVYDILNQDLEEATQEEPDSDIWAHEARSTRSHAKASRPEKRPNGPWSRLNGQVDIRDD